MKLILTLITTALLTACSSVNIDTYKNNQPLLILEEFFKGDLSAHGIIKNRSGEVIRYFNVTMTGSWDENGTGTLEEKFIFDDNSIQFRTWTFTPIKNTTGTIYKAVANDTLAETIIDLSGNAFFMNYDLKIDYQGDEVVVNIDDKMYLTNNTVMINESVMSKFGIEVGYITLTIIKTDK